MKLDRLILIVSKWEGRAKFEWQTTKKFIDVIMFGAVQKIFLRNSKNIKAVILKLQVSNFYKNNC